ncbi:Methyl-accepting chemotaxis protein [Cronobacter condimenti 1330]|uniref:Methyl-accepting chemotaxis protein n=1 Tax=Cronobacter condimenti 1330 TaxID=1073999 RepID=K8A272_9ENTR|nr:diguanylate cyclase regulator RdcB family protein [Cronobacter condimenti]ALB64221.1 methyl-accepting chemotaxis protein [Cronobacter condimenti 1330]CCJ73310.1 Methyl-accepting chemotaxis protein [Cronobacter condimenti 1330]
MNGSPGEGPGRDLRALRGRLMVDLAKGTEEERHCRPNAQHQAVRERLQKSLLPVVVQAADVTQETVELTLLESLTRQGPPGHLALSLTAQALIRRSQRLNERGVSAAFAQQLEVTAGQYRHSAARLESQLRQSDLPAMAQRHFGEVMTHWKRGAFNGWSPAGRCYVALEELRWGAFGDALRLGEAQAKDALLASVCDEAANRLAQSVNASPHTRHFYQQWMHTPPQPGLLAHKDMLCWLGAEYDSERQPVSWSVTQTWQSVSLGMPRLCSARRLVNALVEEVFLL